VHHYFLPKGKYMNKSQYTIIKTTSQINNAPFFNIAINDGRVAYESIVEEDNSLLVAKAIAQSDSPDGPMNLPWILGEATVCTKSFS
jgi:hypothetical protein